MSHSYILFEWSVVCCHDIRHNIMTFSSQKAQLLRDRAAVPAAASLYGALLMQHDLSEGVHGGGNTQELLHLPETSPVLPLR